MIWFVYIVECSDGTLYTGITNDVQQRIDKHNKGKGAKYTKSRIPVKLMMTFECDDKSSAAKKEYQIKQLSRKEKLMFFQ